MEDKLLTEIVKLTTKERAYELIKAVRSTYPQKNMIWTLQKVLYDLRYSKPSAPPLAPPVAQTQTTLNSPSPAEFAALLRKKRASNPQPKPKPKPNIYQGANVSTQNELYRLAGNQGVAHRLVEALALRNPDRSAQWCWEKAISDLERDRSSR